MTSETDVQNAAAAGDSAPGTGPAVHPNYGRITTTGAGDAVLAASLQKVLDGTWADAREFTREAMTPDMLNPIGLGMATMYWRSSSAWPTPGCPSWGSARRTVGPVTPAGR